MHFFQIPFHLKDIIRYHMQISA